MNIAVLGAGSWGTALADLLGQKGYEVRLWVRTPEEAEKLQNTYENSRYLPGVKLSRNIVFSCNMSFCVNGAECVICAVPSGAVNSVSKAAAEYINPEKQIFVSVSKGFEAKTKERLSQVIERNIHGISPVVLSGPSHAEEVAKKLPTTNVAASKNSKNAEYVQELFMTDGFRVYTNDDIVGVELGGALKNIIALCAGVLDGMGMGDNTKAALMTRGMAEIARLGVSMGARKETFFGLTGMGDLIVTCTSMHSRNRRAGILIGQGMTAEKAMSEVKMVVEGIPATIAAYELAKDYNVDMPIVNAIYGVLFEGKNVRESVSGLMNRPKKNEMEELIKW